MAQLSLDEVARYQRDGWVKPAWRLPPERVEAMRAALDDLIARNPGVRPEKLVSAHIEGDNGEGVRGSAAFLDLARDPEIVDLVSEGVIDPAMVTRSALQNAASIGKNILTTEAIVAEIPEKEAAGMPGGMGGMDGMM